MIAWPLVSLSTATRMPPLSSSRRLAVKAMWEILCWNVTTFTTSLCFQCMWMLPMVPSYTPRLPVDASLKIRIWWHAKGEKLHRIVSSSTQAVYLASALTQEYMEWNLFNVNDCHRLLFSCSCRMLLTFLKILNQHNWRQRYRWNKW